MMLLNRNRPWIRAAVTRAISQSSRTTSSAASKSQSSSTSGAKAVTEKPSKDTSVDYSFENPDVVTRKVAKLPARDPLVKKFFLASVDRDMLAYPEVLEKEELDNIVRRLRPISKHFASKPLPSAARQSQSAKHLLDESRALQLFAGNVPESFGGGSYFATEAHLSAEAEAVNAGDALILNANRLFIETISEHGNDEQQRRFLRKLGTGELIGTVSLLEEGNDANNLSTKAELDGSHWILKGKLIIFCCCCDEMSF